MEDMMSATLLTIDVGNTSTSFGCFTIPTDTHPGDTRARTIDGAATDYANYEQGKSERSAAEAVTSGKHNGAARTNNAPTRSANTTSNVDDTAVTFPQLTASCELITKQPATADEVRLQLRDAGRLLGFEHIDAAILSCVVPTLTRAWREALASISASRPLVVGPGLKSGLKLRFDDPSEVGPDRIADAVAARASFGEPVVVVDLGTTTNIEAIDASGAFCGGIIAPGVALGARSLAQAAARLPVIELQAPKRVLGRSTREAMQSGVVLGEAARIDGLLDAALGELVGGSGYTRSSKRSEAGVRSGCGSARNGASSEVDVRNSGGTTHGGVESDTGVQAGADAGTTSAAVPIVITGEHAAAMARLLQHDVIADNTLTLRGLALIWHANQRR